MKCNCQCNCKKSIDVKQLEQTIKRRNISGYINEYGLISLKSIKKVKKSWICCKCSKTIEIGESAFRSFKKHGDYDFEKLYWCVDCMEKLNKELAELEKDIIFEDCLHVAFSDYKY